MSFAIDTRADNVFADSNHSDRTNVSGPEDKAAGRTIDYEQAPLYRLIGFADLIAAGEVISVSESTFTFHIDEALIGEPNESIIQVSKAIFMEFDEPRAIPYDSGQVFLVFLMKDATADHELIWQSMSVAGGSEFPLEGEFVYFTGRFVQGLEHKDYLVHGVTRNIQRYDASLFKQAIRGYRDCFNWPGESIYARRSPELLCNDSLLTNYRRQSGMHEYLARETVKRIP
ncbi:MAG: hypothetical protein GY839_09175 [candidate division Zixibacteria bacterium]|nr:hypothetical protein [candidate division Zixibacteria bacterium]